VITGGLATSAQAVHWPLFGGDNGRSGYQPVGEGKEPVRFLYSKTGPGDQFIKTSIITTTGTPPTQRLIYGTVSPQEATAEAQANANGRVHLRLLETGAAVGPEEGIKIDDDLADADVFGPGAASPAPASVSFADTSGPAGLGQVFAAHNDNQLLAGDIEIAQIDEATGNLVQQDAVNGTAGFTLSSSVVATAPAPDGSRTLFFVAEREGNQKLFRVPIANAASTAASIGTASGTGDVDADPEASPAIVFLRTPTGEPKAYAAVGTAGGVRTFATSDLAPGPASADLGDEAQTPSVPIQPTGVTPSPGTPVTSAPFLYVAARVGEVTQVHKLAQIGNAQALSTTATSAPLAGRPAPALAIGQESEPAGPSSPAKVIVTTGANLYLLKAENLTASGTFSANALSPGSTGFGQTTAAASGEIAYVTSDEGQQFAIKLSDAKPLGAPAFTENAGNGGDRLDRSGMGQPSISHSFVQFASQKGLFVYANACGNQLLGTAGVDTIPGTALGDEVLAFGANDRVSGATGDDCISGGAGNDRLAGNAGEDRISGEGGGDRALGGPGHDLLLGGGGRDRLVGATGRDRLTGGSGNDRAQGGSGNDVLRGGKGNDGLSGGSGKDKLSGDAGRDRIRGGKGNDRVAGGPGNDFLEGGPGGDRILGRSGRDRIRARDGRRDRIHCGRGRDTVVADRRDRVRGCERVIRRR